MMVTGVLRLDGAGRPRAVRRRWSSERLLARYPKFSMRPLPTSVAVRAAGLDRRPGLRPRPAPRRRRDPCRRRRPAALVSELLGTAPRHAPLALAVPPRRVPGDRRAAAALVARLHHCIADGIALASVLLSLTDDNPDVAPDASPATVTTDLRDPRRPGLVRRVADGSRDVAEVTGVDLVPHGPAAGAARRPLRLAGRPHRRGPGLRLPRPAHPADRPARHSQGRRVERAAGPATGQAGRRGART